MTLLTINIRPINKRAKRLALEFHTDWLIGFYPCCDEEWYLFMGFVTLVWENLWDNR